MSLATWKALYYPESAKEAAKRGVVAAIEHSLTKWRGLMASTLKAHKVHVTTWGDLDDGTSQRGIDSTTCALCMFCATEEYIDCDLCPLPKLRKGVPCYTQTPGEVGSPFGRFTDGKPHNPKPMIALLEAALKVEKEKAK